MVDVVLVGRLISGVPKEMVELVRIIKNIRLLFQVPLLALISHSLIYM